jgi:hypothetical protein
MAGSCDTVMNLRVKKMMENSWLTQQMTASQQELNSMELVKSCCIAIHTLKHESLTLRILDTLYL